MTLPFDITTIQATSLLAYTLVFFGGLLTSLGPCNIATIPLIIGFVGGSREITRSRSFTLSLAFALGLAITFMLLGVAAALIGGLFGASTRWWYYVVAGICFFIGLKLDQWLATKGIFVAIFTVLGVIGGANVAYRQILEVFKDKDRQKPKDGSN